MADNKKLLFLSNTKESLEYASPSSFANKIYPKRENPSAHADFITRKMLECRIQSTHQTQALTQEQVAAIHYKDGMYLEFSGAQNYDLATKSLEHFASGIRLLNVKKEENITKATVYVPNGKEKVFLNKVEAYAQSSLTGDKIKNDNLISSIENIRLAILESFWIGDIDSIPKEDISAWCEVWLRCDTGAIDGVVSNFFEWCKSFEILFKTDKIVFPERLVVIVYANQLQLKKLISACEYIAEIRRAPEIATFFDELTFSEQKEWCDDLVYRTDFTDSNTTVCVLDTGINKEHPLIEPYTDSQYVQAVDASWNILDKNGHGTAMAGVALYRNLQESLESSEKIQISHKLESIKILPDNSANTPQLYGAITKQAVALAEIANPRANRVICMAVTSDVYNTNDGSPTSWSAAVDSLISGDEEGGQKRLFFVSAGNVDTSELQDRGFYEANILHNVESPGQAWNAITVGGYNNNIKIKDPSFNNWYMLALAVRNNGVSDFPLCNKSYNLSYCGNDL